MTFVPKHTAAPLVILSLLLGHTRPALADVAACVQSHASGQREAKAGRLAAASDLFADCVSQEGCPDAIRSECAEFRKETERNLPTLVFAALDEQGKDLVQVRVYSDDRMLAEALDGRPIAVDPGQHHLKFQLASGQVLETDVLVRQGEKNRIVSLRAKSAEAVPAAQASGNEAKLPLGLWVASGVGAAALASWGTFALLGHGKQSTIDACSPSCPESSRADYDAMHRDYVIADISLGVAVASAGVATWLFLSRDRANRAEQPAVIAGPRLSILPLVSTRAAGLVLNASAF